VRKSKVWKKLLGVEHVVFGDGDFETPAGGPEVVVLAVRPGLPNLARFQSHRVALARVTNHSAR
jgi:hypothetical protein